MAPLKQASPEKSAAPHIDNLGELFLSVDLLDRFVRILTKRFAWSSLPVRLILLRLLRDQRFHLESQPAALLECSPRPHPAFGLLPRPGGQGQCMAIAPRGGGPAPLRGTVDHPPRRNFFTAADMVDRSTEFCGTDSGLRRNFFTAADVVIALDRGGIAG